jgi:hypothetical protein
MAQPFAGTFTPCTQTLADDTLPRPTKQSSYQVQEHQHTYNCLCAAPDRTHFPDIQTRSAAPRLADRPRASLVSLPRTGAQGYAPSERRVIQ